MPAHIQTEESVEESSSMTSQREETKTSQVRTEEIEEGIATPIFETKDFLPYGGSEEWGATVYDVSTQTEPKFFVDQFSQTGNFVEQRNGIEKFEQQKSRAAKSSKELKESTKLKNGNFESRNLKIKIPDVELKTLRSKPLSAPCGAATEEKTTKKSTQNKENVVKSRERVTSKTLRDESQSKSSFSPFNRSFSSPGCMNTLSLADDVDCDVIEVCDKLPPLNPQTTSRRSSLSRSGESAQAGERASERGETGERANESPTSAFERNIGVEIPAEFKRPHHNNHQRAAKVESRRPPLSTASVTSEHRSPQRRVSRYKEMQMRNSPSPEVLQSSILHHQPNDEVIIRGSGGKAKRYRVKDHYREPVQQRCPSPAAQDPRRFRSRAQQGGREVPVEVRGARQQDFVDGTHLRRASGRRSSANLEERKEVNPGSPQNREAFQRRQQGGSRPRSVTGNWKPQSYSPVMGETPSTIKTRDKVYKPREVYETDDYTFVICPKGSSRR